MLKKSFAWPVIASVATVLFSITALGQADQVGVGTEIKMSPPASGVIYFSPCKNGVNSSCAVFSKVDKKKGNVTEGKRCTMMVSPLYVSKLDFPGGKMRTFKVTRVGRTFDDVTSLELEGAKYPIRLTCQDERIDDGIPSIKNRVPITETGLRGFKEFQLGKVKYHKGESTSSPKPLKATPAKNQGSSY